MAPFFLDTVYKPMHPLFCQHCDAVTCILLQVVSVFVSLLTSLSMFYLAWLKCLKFTVVMGVWWKSTVIRINGTLSSKLYAC